MGESRADGATTHARVLDISPRKESKQNCRGAVP